MEKNAKIYIAGHRGLVGSAILRLLMAKGFNNVVCRTHSDLDLTHQASVDQFFEQQRPEYVFMAAARVGGILANSTYPANFIRDNLMIHTNVIDTAYRKGVKKLLFLGSSCVYPKHCPQPIKEEYLLTGSLEPTNQWYAVAKIAGIKLCQAYRRQHNFNAICLMPTNLYGPGDNFDLKTAHVLPALIRKFHEAKLKAEQKVLLWGTGIAKREFLHVDDLADAVLLLMERYDSGEPINIGSGKDISIRELSAIVGDIVGYKGQVEFDPQMPDGTPRKLLDITKLSSFGWKPKVELIDGIKLTYEWFTENWAEQNNSREEIPYKGASDSPVAPSKAAENKKSCVTSR